MLLFNFINKITSICANTSYYLYKIRIQAYIQINNMKKDKQLIFLIF